VHLVVPRRTAAYIRDDIGADVLLEPFERPTPIGLDVPTWYRMCREVVARIRGVHPDVVHLQQGDPVFNLALRWLRRYPLVVTVHEPSLRGRPRRGRVRFPHWMLTRAFRRGDRLIVYSEYARAELEHLGLPAARIHLTSRPRPVFESARGGEQATEPKVLFFGRIWPYKGLEYLIQAEPRVSAEIPDVKFVIAGAGESLERYRPLVRNPERFEVRNYEVSKHERDALFAQASVVVLPYVDAYSSAVVPIAYLNRKPVIAASVGGLPEAVEDGRTGLLVEPRDPAALAAALVRLLSDERLRRELGEAGRRRLDAESAPELVARATLDVYRLAIGR